MTEKLYQQLVEKYVPENEQQYFLRSQEGRYQNRFYLMFFKNIPKDAKILNIGCGTGTDPLCLHNRGYTDITGIDIDENMLKVATKRCPFAKLFKASAYELPFQDNTFDIVTMIATNEFLDANKAFKEASRVLKSGGKIYFENFNTLINKDLKKVPFIKKFITTNKDYFTYYHLEIEKIATTHSFKITKTGIFTGEPIKNKRLLARLFYGFISFFHLYLLFAPACYFYAEKQ